MSLKWRSWLLKRMRENQPNTVAAMMREQTLVAYLDQSAELMSAEYSGLFNAFLTEQQKLVKDRTDSAELMAASQRASHQAEELVIREWMPGVETTEAEPEQVPEPEINIASAMMNPPDTEDE